MIGVFWLVYNAVRGSDSHRNGQNHSRATDRRCAAFSPNRRSAWRGPIRKYVSFRACRRTEPPRAERRDGAFIAPRPVPSPTTAAAPQRGTADPFAEAEMANASSGLEPRRGRNIFRRMTGLLREEGEQQVAQQPAAPAPAADSRVETRVEAEPQQPAQPRLSGLDVGRRGPLPSAEDEQLDIPAFLRRQAN